MSVIDHISNSEGEYNAPLSKRLFTIYDGIKWILIYIYYNFVEQTRYSIWEPIKPSGEPSNPYTPEYEAYTQTPEYSLYLENFDLSDNFYYINMAAIAVLLWMGILAEVAKKQYVINKSHFWKKGNEIVPLTKSELIKTKVELVSISHIGIILVQLFLVVAVAFEGYKLYDQIVYQGTAVFNYEVMIACVGLFFLLLLDNVRGIIYPNKQPLIKSIWFSIKSFVLGKHYG